ncbi:MAG: hypothetical protein KIT34_06980 [Cyanobacteria bacterium TGS_CYA1]|nr:hypothetical protein [Cyanobacteria bacterium TGS_CYA1]
MVHLFRRGSVRLLTLLSICASIPLVSSSIPSYAAQPNQGVHNEPKDHAEHRDPAERKEESAVYERLEKGEIIVGYKTIGETKFVTGRMIINQPPEKIWPIMVNPYEFKGTISPRMTDLSVIVDQANTSTLKVNMDVMFPIPPITYIVKSKYEHSALGGKIDFWRIGGTLKDFRGQWIMIPREHGTKTELAYSMYLDPGFYVPQWIVRQGVKAELPKTLEALRSRVKSVWEDSHKLAHPSIMAAAPYKAI